VKYQSVLTLAPLRISFLGGGTDLPGFYKAHTGKVVSAAINKYVYVHVKRHDPLFQERYRVSYSQIEYADNRDQIQNGIARSCLEFLNIDEPLQISTSADIPASSGLGSSSSFAVALLLGLHELLGQSPSAAQLAEEAAHVEIEMLNEPIGKQDQYSAAFGGLNQYVFEKNERVTIEPLPLSAETVKKFFANSLLIWTEEARSASVILEDQRQNEDTNVKGLVELTRLVDRFKEALLKPEIDYSQLGSLIKQGWELKQNFSTLISTAKSEEIFTFLEKNNSLGYKLLGAGGGGFIYSIFEQPSSTILPRFADWKTFIPSLDNAGARVASLI
jgi:D-glycero-alpha-D-manno-heptose-7-phosphate kinase